MPTIKVKKAQQQNVKIDKVIEFLKPRNPLTKAIKSKEHFHKGILDDLDESESQGLGHQT